MQTHKWLSGLLVLALLASLTPLAAQAQPVAQTGNLLLNGGFETVASSATTGDNWLPWWKESTKPPSGFNYAYKPSWNVEKISSGAARDLILAGNNSQRVINNWDPWWAGVKQTVNVAAGTRVRLTANARVWTAASGWPTPSDTTVAVKVLVGLEPNGTGDQFANTVIWSGSISPHNGWQTVSVEGVVGSAGRVTAILSADYQGFSRLFMSVFFDEVTLTVVDASGTPSTATLTPTRTNTPLPNTTATPTSTPTSTNPPPLPTTFVPDTYVIQRGDTLGSIARRFGLSLSALIAANNIKDPNKIFVGQVLVIKNGASTPPAAIVYVVKRGDTLSRIAKIYSTTVSRLKLLNNLKTDTIFIGQRLLVGP